MIDHTLSSNTTEEKIVSEENVVNHPDHQASTTPDAGSNPAKGAQEPAEVADVKLSPEELRFVIRILPEMTQLIDQFGRHSNVSPSVVALAKKLHFTDVAAYAALNDDDSNAIAPEYFFVATRFARNQGQKEDVLRLTLDGLDHAHKSLQNGSDGFAGQEKSRLLHLARVGLNAYVYEEKQAESEDSFAKRLVERLDKLAPHYEGDHFFNQLLAQATSFQDREKSETYWEQAVSLAPTDEAWNARGTWYKDVYNDFDQAESAYKKGLEFKKDSALLHHNLALLLVEKGEAMLKEKGEEIKEGLGHLIKEADGLLNKAHRLANRSLRHHINTSRDRLKSLRKKSGLEIPRVKEGETVSATVASIAPFGLFMQLPTGEVGLLHQSEIDHAWIESVEKEYNVGQKFDVKVMSIEEKNNERRLSLSRKVLIEKPADFDESLALPPHKRGKKNKPNEGRGNRRSQNQSNDSKRKSKGNRSQKRTESYSDSGAGVTIADLLQAKLKNASDNN